jgi:hypothetical protein
MTRAHVALLEQRGVLEALIGRVERRVPRPDPEPQRESV